MGRFSYSIFGNSYKQIPTFILCQMMLLWMHIIYSSSAFFKNISKYPIAIGNFSNSFQILHFGRGTLHEVDLPECLNVLSYEVMIID